MDENDNLFKSFKTSFGESSHYSDVYDDYDQIINQNSEVNKKNIINNNQESFKENNNNNVNQDSIHIPADTNEKSEKKIYKTKTIDEVDEENNINNFSININNNNSININNNNNNSFNVINNNNNNNNSIKYDDDLYSIRLDSNNASEKDSDNEEVINKKKFDNSELFKSRKITFDNNLQPLDNASGEENSNININLNINSFTKKKEIVRSIKRFNTVIDKSSNTPTLINKFNYDMRTKTTNIGSHYSRKRNHTYFDLENILKKAVILNGKKGKNKYKSSLFQNNDNESLSNKFNDSQNSIFNEPYQINNIKFNNIKIDDLNTNHLKKHLRRISVESKNNNPKNNFFKTLIELQNFYIDESPVWVIKLSHDGKYLASGCKSGKIQIHEVIGYNYSKFKTSYDRKNILEYLNFINETPYKTLERHKSDIIDLSWSPFYPNLLLSASFDHFVFLWDISQEGNNCLLNEYEHSDIVTSVSFNPNIRNIFISGCLDTFVRIWKFNYFDNIINTFDDNYNNSNINNDNSDVEIININMNNKNKNKKNKNILQENKTNNSFDNNRTTANLEQSNKDQINYFNIEHKITSLSFFPDGSKIGVGTEKGRIYVYNTFPTINYNNNFFCSNKKFGIFHGGKKVTNIQFIDKIHAIISTCDSYIRLVDMSAGRILYNYKGYVNKNTMGRCYMDLSDNVIIAGSEDGYCYLWNLFNGESNKAKNKNYERYKPFSKELIECSLIASEICYVKYMQKLLKLTNKVLITSIIINGTSKGRLEILLNIRESF